MTESKSSWGGKKQIKALKQNKKSQEIAYRKALQIQNETFELKKDFDEHRQIDQSQVSIQKKNSNRGAFQLANLMKDNTILGVYKLQ